MDALLQGYRDNRLLAGLGPKTFELLRPHLRTTSLNAGVTLCQAGSNIEQVYFPHSGLVSLLVATDDGQAVETTIVGREGAVGLQAGLGPRRSFTLAVTQIGGNFSVISASRLCGIVRNDSTLKDLIVRYIETCWEEAQQSAACNAAHHASARFCHWLLQCADRIGGDEVALTQESFAQMLAVRRTTITLLAQSLQELGYITYRRGRLRILDRKGLKKKACDCSNVLQGANTQVSISPEMD